MKTNRNALGILLAAMLLTLSPLSLLAGNHILLKSPEDYQVFTISPNGKWACGVYNDYSYSNYGFRWNLESGSIELLSTGDESEAWCISNDGVVCGTFTDRTYNENHAAVSMPGYYDTEWHRLELPEGNILGGCAYGITPDGHGIAGTVFVGKNVYQTYIWTDGHLTRTLSAGGIAQAYTISPDGLSAGGWIDTGNRQAAYWKADRTIEFLSDYKSPWSSVRKFSPDGKKILFWGGWNSTDEEVARLRAVYDIETGTTTEIPVLTPEAEFELFDISNNYTLVGQESNRGYINRNGVGQYADAFLAELGIDVSTLGILKPEGYDYYIINRVQALSADDSVLCLLYYDDQGAFRSMILKTNVEAGSKAPAEVKAMQLRGIAAAKIKWTAPLGATTIDGYNVYRNGEKINEAAVTTTEYVDANLAFGNTYAYTISAIYENGEGAQSTAATITLAENKTEAPQDVLSRQAGYNNALIRWNHPESNLIVKRYFDLNNSNIRGFGVSADDITFENAIRYGADEVRAYAGCKVKSVQFYPMTEQTGWKVNLYTYDEAGALQPLYTQDITQPLVMGQLNTVVLDTPQDLPDGELLVAIQVTVSTASGNVLGMDFGQATEEYSDLVRQTNEADFYSITESSSTSGYFYRTQWLISAILTPAGASDTIDDIDHYNVYIDGTKAAETADTQTLCEAMADGNYQIGVEAIYADGRVSDQTTAPLTIKSNSDMLPSVEVVNTQVPNESTLQVAWDAPQCFDKGYISYSGEAASSKTVHGPQENNYGLMAGVIYPSSMFRGYDGYEIRSVRFFPLADATFTILLFKDNVQVSETYVEDYKLGVWNTIELDAPITVSERSEYFLVIDCYDVTPNAGPLAVDTTTPVTYYSDLYSLDGLSWESISATAIYGNWMMGLNVVSTEELPLDILGYDVNIDGVKLNNGLLTNTEATFDIPGIDDQKHSVSVDTTYPVGVVKRGATNYFYLNESGIDHLTAHITLLQGANVLTLVGVNVDGIRLYSITGALVGSAEGDSIGLDGLSNGIYLLQANVDGKNLVRKIRIDR